MRWFCVKVIDGNVIFQSWLETCHMHTPNVVVFKFKANIYFSSECGKLVISTWVHLNERVDRWVQKTHERMWESDFPHL